MVWEAELRVGLKRFASGMHDFQVYRARLLAQLMIAADGIGEQHVPIL